MFACCRSTPSEDFWTRLCFTSAIPTPKNSINAQQAIDGAMTAVLWDANIVSEFSFGGGDYGEIKLQLNGSAEWYFQRREAPAFKAAVAALDQGRTPP